MPNVRIVLTSHGRGEVFIDGAPVTGVTAIGVRAGVEATNRVTLTLLANEVTIEAAEADVTSIEKAPKKIKTPAGEVRDGTSIMDVTRKFLR